ncbi:TraR/DksA family transcriptional regulator [Candidatus Dependentiae bacterium]|nr:TraR/DksA family transcriptional regulator [Candidatus Dependentiae bacterium]
MKQRVEVLTKIKQGLLTRKAEMTDQLTQHSHEKVSDGQVQDSGDEALSLSMEKLQNSLQKNEIDEIRLIDDALIRLDRGEYGLCVDCSEPISDRRLENFPYAARCIVCQEAFEQ